MWLAESGDARFGNREASILGRVRRVASEPQSEDLRRPQHRQAALGTRFRVGTRLQQKTNAFRVSVSTRILQSCPAALILEISGSTHCEERLHHGYVPSLGGHVKQRLREVVVNRPATFNWASVCHWPDFFVCVKAANAATFRLKTLDDSPHGAAADQRVLVLGICERESLCRTRILGQRIAVVGLAGVV